MQPAFFGIVASMVAPQARHFLSLCDDGGWLSDASSVPSDASLVRFFGGLAIDTSTDDFILCEALGRPLASIIAGLKPEDVSIACKASAFMSSTAGQLASSSSIAVSYIIPNSLMISKRAP